MAARKKPVKRGPQGRKKPTASREIKKLLNKNKKLGFPYSPGVFGIADLNSALKKLESDLRKRFEKKLEPEKLQKLINAAEITKMGAFNQYIENSIKIISLTETDEAKKKHAISSLRAIQEKVKESIQWKEVEARGFSF